MSNRTGRLVSFALGVLALSIAAPLVPESPFAGTAEAQFLRSASTVVRSSEEPDRDDDDSDDDWDQGSSRSTGSRLRRLSDDQRWLRRLPYVFESVSALVGSDRWRQTEGASEAAAVLFVPQLEGGVLFEGVGRGWLSLRVIFPIELELAVDYALYFEPVSHGVDFVGLGRAGVAWRALDSGPVQIRTGMAARQWVDYLGSRFGFDGFIGIDIFPFDPLIFSIDASVGTIGDAFLTEFRATAGVLLGDVEVYAGYHVLFLESQETEAQISLDAPMLGARLWI